MLQRDVWRSRFKRKFRPIPTTETGLDQALSNLPKLDPRFGTLWHGERFFQVSANTRRLTDLEGVTSNAGEICELRQIT